jgi:acetyl esterase
MAELDTDMKHVLDAMMKLNPLPIDNLSPEEARKQPSPADGVKELLKEQGKSTAPEPSIATRNVTYPAGAGTQTARIYSPEGAKELLPIVIYFHGGGSSSPTSTPIMRHRAP